MSEMDWDPTRLDYVLGCREFWREVGKDTANEGQWICALGGLMSGELRLVALTRRDQEWTIAWDTVLQVGIGGPTIQHVYLGVDNSSCPLFMIVGLSGARGGGFVFFSWNGVSGKVVGILGGQYYELEDLNGDGVREIILHTNRYHIGPTKFRYDAVSQSLLPIDSIEVGR
jgi:hypothetical protein